MNVKLHIEQLILEGFPLPGTQGAAVKSAVEAELGRLVQANGIGTDLQHRQMLQQVGAPGFQYPAAATPGALGKQIARSVYAGIGKTK
jgi:hypothetical protein